MDNIVFAVISPKSIGGLPLFEATAPITLESVNEFKSEAAIINETANQLKDLGFRIEAVGPVTISFSGPRQLFQSALGVSLEEQRRAVSPAHEVAFFAASQEDAARLLQPPAALAPLVEGMAIAQPPELYAMPEAPIPPLVEPDPAAYRYLFAPDELAVVTRAARVHRLGVTGRDVVVGMIDTGHYAHQFFAWHGYRRLSVLLGPGAADPAHDAVSHGTGESANIFAAAPDIRLLPIKGLNDPTGDFNVAMAASPRPQIISNSWGYDVDYRSWAALQAADLATYTYLKTLEAAVATAIASRIVVCFSAGNGQRGFPGCHPDVVNVGGAHINYPSLEPEASSYASSFASQLYPGRQCPDLCGITGRAVYIMGDTRAPSHMLPVEPGSQLDQISPSTGSDTDGWGLFSGTSAACPLVAGVVALLLEKDKTLTPAKVKENLMKSARDITIGTTGLGDTAGPGPDAATGAGLVDAKWAYLITMGAVAAEFIEAPPERQSAMIASGQMPQLPREFVNDIMETLRSR